MKSGRFERLLLIIMLGGFLGMIAFTEAVLLSQFSIGSILAAIGILIMFGLPAGYYFVSLIVFYCGHKVIGQIVLRRRKGLRWQCLYTYMDKNGKYKFGTLTTYQDTASSLVLVKYWWFFKWSSLSINETSQKELDKYAWSNITKEEALIKSNKYNKWVWITAIIGFIVSAIMIIVGGFLG